MLPFHRNQTRLRPDQGGKFHPPVVPTVQQKCYAYQCPGVDWSDALPAAGPANPACVKHKPGDVVSWGELEIGEKFVWESSPEDKEFRKKISASEFHYGPNKLMCRPMSTSSRVIVRE